MKHFLGPILGAEVAQKRPPFPAVVTRTEMGNANICILCDVVKKVKRRVCVYIVFTSETVAALVKVDTEGWKKIE